MIPNDSFFTTKMDVLERTSSGGRIVISNTPVATYDCSPVFPDDADFDLRFRTDSAQSRWVTYVKGTGLNLSFNARLRIDDIEYTIERINPWASHEFTEIKLTLSPANYKTTVN